MADEKKESGVMADEKKATPKKKVEVNEYGQTEEQFKADHGGRSPEEVNPPSEPYSEEFQEDKKKARWG